MRRALHILGSVCSALTRPLFARPGTRSDPFADERASMTPRERAAWLAGGLARRLLMAPVLLAAIMAFLVYGTTHRWASLARPHRTPLTPASVNLFYREVGLTTSDGVHLAAWHIPAWSAAELGRHDERQLRRRRPGLVLCHGAWSDRSQMLYLAPALHAAGYELLLVDLRGCGDSGGGVGLGLDEWKDVQAAVQWLQEFGTVDPQRIGVLASDTSTAAVLRAAAGNAAVRVVVADRPCRTLGSFVRQRFNAIGLPGGSLGRLYEWSFALGRAADLSEASAQRWAERLGPQQALLVTARRADRYVPSGEPLVVLSAARCDKALQMNPFSPDVPGQPALLPRGLLKFLGERLGPTGLARQPTTSRGV